MTGERELQTVFVLITGCYENYGLTGIFATSEAAMLFWPKCEWVEVERVEGKRRWSSNYLSSAHRKNDDDLGEILEEEVRL